MALKYGIIEIFTSEETRWQEKAVGDAVVDFVRQQKIAARCMVTRGTDGCYENGEIATTRWEILSFNMPIQITIVLPLAEVDRVLVPITAMVENGIIGVRELEVVGHRTRSCLIPRQARVRDAMTSQPQCVNPSTPLDQVVRLLLSSVFGGVPVVDQEQRPVGFITQGDLVYRGGMPLRLGLLALSAEEKMDAVLNKLANQLAANVMTQPVVTIREDVLLTEAVAVMLKKTLKRLPVVDKGDKVVGILSRLDVFRTIMQEAPDWKSFAAQRLQVDQVRYVADVMRRDSHTVLPETSIEEILQVIDSNDIQRVAVVDGRGRFLGLISDQDLLMAFAEEREGIWDYLASRLPFGMRRQQHLPAGWRLSHKTAADAMLREIITVREDTSIDEAIRLMVEKGLKRLPVLDDQGLFKGMVSRDSLLRTGFDRPHQPRSA
jgi:CBS domain-containing protein